MPESAKQVAAVVAAEQALVAAGQASRVLGDERTISANAIVAIAK